MAHKCFFCLFISLFPFFPPFSNAQNSFSDSVYLANKNIYDFNFRSADSAIRDFNRCHPKYYLSMLLSANYYWWLIITGDDTSETRQKYYQNLNASLGLLETKKQTVYANDSLYALITTYAYKSRIHSMNNEYFAALGQLNSCIAQVKQSFGKEQEYEWFLLTSGMYNYYVEAVKKNYPFLIPYLIFLPSGNQLSGITFLERASSSSDPFLSTEADYFLMKIYLEEEKQFSLARKYSEKLLNKYPANLLYRYYQFKTYLQENRINEATKELGLLKFHAEKNQQLSEKQKVHFLSIAREDLKKYYLRKNNK